MEHDIVLFAGPQGFGRQRRRLLNSQRGSVRCQADEASPAAATEFQGAIGIELNASRPRSSERALLGQQIQAGILPHKLQPAAAILRSENRSGTCVSASPFWCALTLEIT